MYSFESLRRGWEGEGQQERVSLKQTPSMLSTEPEVGLDLKTLRSQPNPSQTKSQSQSIVPPTRSMSLALKECFPVKSLMCNLH